MQAKIFEIIRSDNKESRNRESRDLYFALDESRRKDLICRGSLFGVLSTPNSFSCNTKYAMHAPKLAALPLAPLRRELDENG